MMDIKKDIITALVDGKIVDTILKQEILTKIETDKEFAVEYKVQSLVKNLIKEKVVFQKTPDKIRAKILKSIGSDTKVKSTNKSFLSNIFYKPSFSFATAFVVILAVVLIILNRPGTIEKKNFAIEQTGSDNMYVQAKNNFNRLLDNKMVPQITSSNAEEIQKFFHKQGVQYPALIPSIVNWNLRGAVVSEDKDEKFAHLIYAGKKGELAYLFQVDETVLQRNKIISLSEDLIQYLDEGNCYFTLTNSLVILFKKLDNNICAVVSNGNPKELENIFCSFN